MQKINFTLGKTNIVPTAGPAITPSSNADKKTSSGASSGGDVISSNTVNSGNTYNSTGFAINNSGAFDLKDMLSRQINPDLRSTGGLF